MGGFWELFLYLSGLSVHLALWTSVLMFLLLSTELTHILSTHASFRLEQGADAPNAYAVKQNIAALEIAIPLC